MSRWCSCNSARSVLAWSAVIQRTRRLGSLYSFTFGAFSIHSHLSQALRRIARMRAKWRLAVAALARARLRAPIVATTSRVTSLSNCIPDTDSASAA